MMNEALRDWLLDHFRDDFESQLFKNSMGQQSVEFTGIRGVVGIVAQAVAYYMHENPRFSTAIVNMHERLLELFELSRQNPSHPSHQFAINVGPIIEAAIHAIVKYHQERGHCGD